MKKIENINGLPKNKGLYFYYVYSSKDIAKEGNFFREIIEHVYIYKNGGIKIRTCWIKNIKVSENYDNIDNEIFIQHPYKGTMDNLPFDRYNIYLLDEEEVFGMLV